MEPPGACGLAWQGSTGSAYNEEAFRYFLEIERRRVEIQDRSLFLLVVHQRDTYAPMAHDFAIQVFASLCACVRETDFIGWYHEGRAIGAVLTQRADIHESEASRQVRTRIDRGLSSHLTGDMSDRLRTTVHRISSRSKRRSY
jgi:hypothetical protein